MRLAFATLALALALGACGRVGFEPRAHGLAQGDGGAPGDGATGSGDGSVGTCDPVACSNAGGACSANTCVITCTSTSSFCQFIPVTCPAGGPCDVTCSGANSCEDGVSCGDATSCAIHCPDTASCGGQVTCGAAGPCSVDCAGAQSCGQVTCGGFACNIQCTGTGACVLSTACDSSCNCTVACPNDSSGCLFGVGLTCPDNGACVEPSGYGCTTQAPCAPTC